MLCSVAFEPTWLRSVGLILLAFSSSSIQLVPDGTLLFHLALIICMVAIVNATLLKPINRILEEREKRTKGRVAEAQALQSSLDEKLRQYERALREARANGYALTEEQRKAASQEHNRQVAAVKAEVNEILEREKRAMKAEEEGIKNTLIQDARVRAQEIGAQILGRPVGPA